jgi:hypothetical protein
MHRSQSEQMAISGMRDVNGGVERLYCLIKFLLSNSVHPKRADFGFAQSTTRVQNSWEREMDFITEPERKTPVVGDFDLLICGGGFAGVAAALSAAKLGVKVLLLERYGFLGGLVTSSLVITTPPLNNGINIEIADRLKKRNVYVPCKHSGPDTEWLEMRAVDPEVVKKSCSWL